VYVYVYVYMYTCEEISTFKLRVQIKMKTL